MAGKKRVPERRSGLRPSKKELPERRSGAFRHKNTPACRPTCETREVNQLHGVGLCPSWEVNNRQLGKKFPAFYGIRRFITVFTRARLSWARWIRYLGRSKGIRPRYWVAFRNIYSDGLLPPAQPPSLSAVRDCLFNVPAVTLHICRPSPPSATWGRTMPWW
jgi:hypothetical protein